MHSDKICQRKDDIKEIKDDVREIKENLTKFQLETAVKIAKLEIESQRNSKTNGFFFGSLASIIIAIIVSFIKDVAN